MSSESRADVKDAVKAELQLILIESVIGGKKESWREVLRLFSDKKVFPQSKPGVLDFTCEETNKCKSLEHKRKLNLDGKPRYRTYSPLMVAVEEGNRDLVMELLEAGASVGFKNKVRKWYSLLSSLASGRKGGGGVGAAEASEDKTYNSKEEQ